MNLKLNDPKIKPDYDLSEMMQTTLQESSLIQAGLATFAK